MRPLFIAVSLLMFMLFSIYVKADRAESSAEAQALEREPIAYTGWAVLQRQHLDSSAKDDDWIYMKGIEIMDIGEKLRLMDGDKPTPYRVELIVITYEKSNTTVLKLALYEDGNDRAITYIWGEPGAGRLGMNLRWMQVGLTRTDLAKSG